jgi:phage baseplate assembly protein gpV
MTIPRTLPEQIADLYHKLAEMERRGRNRKRTGTIKEVDNSKGLARVLISKGGDKEYVSAWLPWKEVASGGIKSHIPPTAGEQVDVVSESGDLTDAVIDMSSPSDANPRPHDGPEAVLVKGDTRIVIGDGTVAITADVTITGLLTVVGDSVTHNGKNIGDTHKHTDVLAGGDLTGPPQG